MAQRSSVREWSRCESHCPDSSTASLSLGGVVSLWLVGSSGGIGGGAFGSGRLARSLGGPSEIGGQILAAGCQLVAHRSRHVGGLVGHRPRVLGGDGSEFGGLGGHVAQYRSGLASCLIDHVLELANPALAEFARSCRLIPKWTLAGRFVPVGLAGARNVTLSGLIVRVHLNTSC